MYRADYVNKACECKLLSVSSVRYTVKFHSFMIHNNFSLLNVKTTVIDALLYFPAIAAFLLSGLIFIIKINGLFGVNLYVMLLPLLVNTKPRVSL